MAEPKDPALPRMREWAMFRASARERRKRADDGRAPPRISELIMMHLPGTPAQKRAWLEQQRAAGKLDGDDPEEIAEADALLAMLLRMSRSKGGEERRHLDELLDEGLEATFPASDPVSVGHFTSTEAPSRPVDTTVADLTRSGKKRNGKSQTRRRRAA